MLGTPYTAGQLATTVLTAAVAAVTASVLITTGLGAAAAGLGIAGAATNTAIGVFGLAGSLVGLIGGFHYGPKIHEKMTDMNFSRKNKRLHTANRPAMNSQKKTFGQKLSNIFKRSKAPKGTIVLTQNKNKKNNNNLKR